MAVQTLTKPSRYLDAHLQQCTGVMDRDAGHKIKQQIIVTVARAISNSRACTLLFAFSVIDNKMIDSIDSETSTSDVVINLNNNRIHKFIVKSFLNGSI